MSWPSWKAHAKHDVDEVARDLSNGSWPAQPPPAERAFTGAVFSGPRQGFAGEQEDRQAREDSHRPWPRTAQRTRGLAADCQPGRRAGRRARPAGAAKPGVQRRRLDPASLHSRRGKYLSAAFLERCAGRNRQPSLDRRRSPAPTPEPLVHLLIWDMPADLMVCRKANYKVRITRGSTDTFGATPTFNGPGCRPTPYVFHLFALGVRLNFAHPAWPKGRGRRHARPRAGQGRAHWDLRAPVSRAPRGARAGSGASARMGRPRRVGEARSAH